MQFCAVMQHTGERMLTRRKCVREVSVVKNIMLHTCCYYIIGLYHSEIENHHGETVAKQQTSSHRHDHCRNACISDRAVFSCPSQHDFETKETAPDDRQRCGRPTTRPAACHVARARPPHQDHAPEVRHGFFTLRFT